MDSSNLQTRGPGRGWPAGVFLITLLIYALLTPRFLRYTQPPSGDQPYYLQTLISLLEDGDLDEYNNYHARASYNQFSPPFGGDYPADFLGILAPYPLPSDGHLAVTTHRPANEWYSKHGLGMPLLILPGWAIGQVLTPWMRDLTLNGSGGWPGTVYEFNLLGALLAVQVFLLAWEVTGRRWIALAVWATLAFSNPQMSYSFLLFPELPAALLTVYAFRRIRLAPGANGNGRWLLVGLCLAYMPWLHARFLPLVLGLTLLALRRLWPVHKSRSLSLVALSLPLLLSGAAMVAHDLWLYGVPWPGMQDHAGFLNPLSASGVSGLLLASLGLLLDQQWGLLVYAPVLALAPVGIVAMRRDARMWALLPWLALVVVPYLGVVVAYLEWWGAWCPPARYLTPVVPLLAIPLAHYLSAAREHSRLRNLYGLLALGGIAIMALCMTHLDYRTPERLPILFNLPTGNASFLLWLESRTGINLRPLIPAVAPLFIVGDYAIAWRPIIIGLGALAALVGGSVLALSRPERQTHTRPKAWARAESG